MGIAARRLKSFAGVSGFIITLTLAAAATAAAPERLLWVVKGGHDVDKQHAEKMYLTACRWVEEQVEPDRAVRPRLTVHVGEACPHSRINGACMNPMLGVLYLPEWDEESAFAVAEATVATALHQLNHTDELMTAGMLMASSSTAREDRR